MAQNTGIARYLKKKHLDEIAAKVTAGSLKMSIHTSGTYWDANMDGTTPQVYGTTGELSNVGTGYTTGGYVLAAPVVAANVNAYQLDFADITTGVGTIAAGSYIGVIYDTTDTNRVLSVVAITVTTGSSGQALPITIPADAFKYS